MCHEDLCEFLCKNVYLRLCTSAFVCDLCVYKGFRGPRVYKRSLCVCLPLCIKAFSVFDALRVVFNKKKK